MEKARHLKEFINQVKDIIEKVGGSDIVRFIPQYEIERLYTRRCHPVRVKATPEQSVPSTILQFSNYMVTLLFKNPHIPVGVGTLALNRLSERLDGMDEGILHYNIITSFNRLKVCRNKNGLLLFEYAIFGNKAGYFLGEVVEEKIILKTFLFLTNNGTPEADKLQTATGLMKEDITYLAIDKLSTFLLSDIAGNERLKEIFIDCGCESLFKIDKSIYFSSEDAQVTSKAELIAKYLHLNVSPLNQHGQAALLHTN